MYLKYNKEIFILYKCKNFNIYRKMNVFKIYNIYRVHKMLLLIKLMNIIILIYIDVNLDLIKIN